MPWHHVIPKHEWKKRFGNLNGCNSDDNLVNLNLENHTQIHRRMGEEGSEVDRIVALRMSGQIGVEEGTRLSQSVANVGNKYRLGKPKSLAELQLCRLNGLKSKGRKHCKEANIKKSESIIGQKRALGSKHSEESRITRSILMTGKKRGPYKKRIR